MITSFVFADLNSNGLNNSENFVSWFSFSFQCFTSSNTFLSLSVKNCGSGLPVTSLLFLKPSSIAAIPFFKFFLPCSTSTSFVLSARYFNFLEECQSTISSW